MDEYNGMRRMHAEAKRRSKERTAAYAKKQLENAITKKIKTTMIGSLASIEEAFGFLWGAHKPESERNEDDVKFELEVWQPLRTEILNKGNTQIRGAVEEISNYNMTWQKHYTNLTIKQDGESNG